MRFREHRKLLSGRVSGRNHAEQLDDGGEGRASSSSLAAYGASAGGDGDEVAVAAAAKAEAEAEAKTAKAKADELPPLRGAGEEGLEMEWWDEAFLTKETRDDKVYIRWKGRCKVSMVLFFFGGGGGRGLDVFTLCVSFV